MVVTYYFVMEHGWHPRKVHDMAHGEKMLLYACFQEHQERAQAREKKNAAIKSKVARAKRRR